MHTHTLPTLPFSSGIRKELAAEPKDQEEDDWEPVGSVKPADLLAQGGVAPVPGEHAVLWEQDGPHPDSCGGGGISTRS